MLLYTSATARAITTATAAYPKATLRGILFFIMVQKYKKISCLRKTRQDIFILKAACILFFEDGTASPLDYKYSVYKGWNPDTYRIQPLFYAILIEENYGCTVNDGYIVYMRSKNRLERIRLFDDDYEEFFDVYNEMSGVLKNEVFPHITDNAIKCEDCPYGKICTRI